MGGNNTETTTGTTGPSNPNVTRTLDMLLGGIQDQWTQGPRTYPGSMYAGVGPITQAGWGRALGAAMNPAFTNGMNQAFNFGNSLMANGGLTGGRGWQRMGLPQSNMSAINVGRRFPSGPGGTMGGGGPPPGWRGAGGNDILGTGTTGTGTGGTQTGGGTGTGGGQLGRPDRANMMLPGGGGGTPTRGWADVVGGGRNYGAGMGQASYNGMGTYDGVRGPGTVGGSFGNDTPQWNGPQVQQSLPVGGHGIPYGPGTGTAPSTLSPDINPGVAGGMFQNPDTMSSRRGMGGSDILSSGIRGRGGSDIAPYNAGVRGRGGNDIAPYSAGIRGRGGNDILPGPGTGTGTGGGTTGGGVTGATGGGNSLGADAGGGYEGDGGQWGNLSTINNIGDMFMGLAGGNGLDEGMTADMDRTRGLADRLGGLAGQWGAPGIMERNLGAVANGQYLRGGNPYFEKNLSTALDQAGAGVNSAIGASGRFGSGTHVNQLGTTLGNLSNSARGQQYETERDRQFQALSGIGNERNIGRGMQLSALGQQGNMLGQAFGMGETGFGNRMGALNGAANMANTAFGMEQQGINNSMGAGNNLGSLFQTSLMPSQVFGGIGGAQDQDTQDTLTGNADWWNRTNNGQLGLLGQLSNILGVAGPMGGQTMTQTQPGVPWWQQALGFGLQGASLFM